MKRAKTMLPVSVAFLFSIGIVQAKPPWAVNTGNSCKSCHGSVDYNGAVVSDKMQVDKFFSLTDLGQQLNGKTRGALKTFFVSPGEVVTLSVRVVDGSAEYGIQLKRLETGGQLDSEDNRLIYESGNLEENSWDKQGDAAAYFTKGPIETEEEGVFTFDLAIDANTPEDVYDLEFAIAGEGSDGGLFYQDEHFYLKVAHSGPVVVKAGRVISWPASATGYVLEVAGAAGGPWERFRGEQGVVGDQKIAVMDTSGSMEFYRLRKEE